MAVLACNFDCRCFHSLRALGKCRVLDSSMWNCKNTDMEGRNNISAHDGQQSIFVSKLVVCLANIYLINIIFIKFNISHETKLLEDSSSILNVYFSQFFKKLCLVYFASKSQYFLQQWQHCFFMRCGKYTFIYQSLRKFLIDSI